MGTNDQLITRNGAPLAVRGETSLDFGDGEHGWVEEHMDATHRQAVVAQASSDQRLAVALANSESLGNVLLDSAVRIARHAQASTAGLDPNNAIDRALIGLAVEIVQNTAEDYGILARGYRDMAVNRAGSDIRKGIPAPPPTPVSTPPPVITYTTGPKMRPARGVADWGREKFVRDDE